jgi:hypothetical protein
VLTTSFVEYGVACDSDELEMDTAPFPLTLKLPDHDSTIRTLQWVRMSSTQPISLDVKTDDASFEMNATILDV